MATRKNGTARGLLPWLLISLGAWAVLTAVGARTAFAQDPKPGERPPGYLGPPQPIAIPGDPTARPGPTVQLGPVVLPNVLVNDKVDDAPDQSQSETTIGVDPTNPLRLVGGFNDCRGFGGASRNGVSGWGFSTDGGANWTGVQTGLPKFAGADFGTRGDPSIDVDSAGNFYYASLYTRAGVAQLLISVHKGRFTDSTFTWNTPTFATSAPVDADKEHIGVDRRSGSETLYVSYTNFGVAPRRIEVVRSTDGGATWSAPVILASGDVQGSVPRVGPDGEVYVLWATWPGAPRTLRIRKSTTWPVFGPEVTAVTMTPARNPVFNSRNPQFPGLEIDRTSGANRGRLYATFDDGRLGGAAQVGTIFLIHSPDGSDGSWSAPIRLDDDADPPSMTETDRWFSWPAVDAAGVVHIGWYDRRLRGASPALTDVFSTQFRVATGVSPNVRITDRSFPMNVPSRCTPNFGDYNGSTASVSRFHFLYGDGRLGNPDTFTAGTLISPILASPTSRETCRPTPTTSTITVLGGPGFFEADVTLRLKEVSPAEPTITATFDPNPVPAPPPAGSTSTMTINTTADTPAGTYALTVEGTDGTVTATTEVTLVVRSAASGAPDLLTPANGADDVSITPTFTWSAAAQATTYKLEIFQGEDCTGTPVRVFDNITGTSFKVPDAQALALDQRFSWRVTARNACGEAVSAQCFRFRTTACVEGWTVKPAVPVTNGPSQPSVVAAAGRIYVIGGGIGPGPNERINQVWEFNPGNNTWTRKADVPPPGAGSTFGSAAELNGKIYVFGGFTTAILNTTWIYDVAANSWSRGRDLPVANFGIAVAAIGGKIYLAYGSGFGQQTWEYDPAADTYTRKADPPVIPAPFRVHGKAIGNEMHAFAGGFEGTAHVIYNAATNTWTTGPPMPFGVTDPAVAVLLGKFHVVGGRPTARTQIFDPAMNTWTQGPPVSGLPGGLDNTDGDALGRNMHVAGGFDGTNSSNAHRLFNACGPPDFVVNAVPPAFNEVCAGQSIDFQVGVEALGRFTSPVTLSGGNLPPNTSVAFKDNPIRPGETTAMRLSTSRPITAGRYAFDVCGQAVEPPPAEPRCTRMSVFISSNPPTAADLITPLNGEVNVPRRPTLSWTEPFVEDLLPKPAAPAGDPTGLTGTTAPETGLQPGAGGDGLTVFGAAFYRLQVARDRDFKDVVVNTEVRQTTFTVPFDLDIATRYFWHVNARNSCGVGPFSEVRSFITGACVEGWAVKPAVPVTDGPSQASVVAAAGKLYVIGGGIGPGPNERINQVWEFDPATDTWTRKADVPAPGAGSTFGSAAEVGGTIYVFGGVVGPPGDILIHNRLWKYNVATNTWTRGRDLPVDNFGSAVAAVGTKIYLAYGSGFVTQTWEYDTVADTFTRKADAPSIPAPFRVHADATGNEMHAFAGGFTGTAHVIYNAATNTWTIGPPMPFGVTDPAVVALGGKYYVIGGRPVARTQVFDPGTNTWSQGPPVANLPAGVDNTDGAALGGSIHLAGGFDGASTNVHRAFQVCGPTSALLIPYVVDGDGTVAGIPNERTSLLINNGIFGTPLSATAFFYPTDGTLDSFRTFSVARDGLLNISHVIREIRGTSGVQNVKGSLAIFATGSIHAMASVANNATDDPAIVDGQPLGGIASGIVPLIQWNDRYRTQVALRASSSTATVQLLAYPPAGGDTPVASSSVIVPPNGLVDFPNMVTALGLPLDYLGQLSWNSTSPITVFSRDVTSNNSFSGSQPVRGAGDASLTVVLGYVEDGDLFLSHLRLNNTGPITANVTVRFVDVPDPRGETPGTEVTRDIPVRRNSATVIENVIRWVLRSDPGTPAFRRGFLVITSPQAVSGVVSLTNTTSQDPSMAGPASSMGRSFTPMVLRVEPLAPTQIGTTSSRIAISNSGATRANVQLMPFNANGTPARPTPFAVSVVGRGQFFTEDIVTEMGLGPLFFGWMTITSDAPVIVYNQRRNGEGGAAVPVLPR